MELILCWEALHWFRNRTLVKLALENWQKVIKSDGRVVVTLPAKDHYLIKNSEHLKDHSYICKHLDRDGAIFYFQDKTEYINLFSRCGFETLSVYRYSHGRFHLRKNDKDLSKLKEDEVFSMYAFLLGKKE